LLEELSEWAVGIVCDATVPIWLVQHLLRFRRAQPAEGADETDWAAPSVRCSATGVVREGSCVFGH
jgi:hypothetical protein